MKIYLDTGNVEEIREGIATRLLDGVTTNPTLIAKEGRDFKTEIKEIVSLFKKTGNDNFTVSAEVTSTDSAERMVEQGRKLAKMDKHILVKVPLTVEGLKAVSIMASESIRCNVTLCFSPNQALLAAKAGAWCVSPFVGRVDDEGWDGLELVRDIRALFDRYGFKTNILAASIRSSSHVTECSQIGADIATMPYKVFQKLYYNPLTDKGMAQFEKDWNAYQEELHKHNR